MGGLPLVHGTDDSEPQEEKRRGLSAAKNDVIMFGPREEGVRRAEAVAEWSGEIGIRRR